MPNVDVAAQVRRLMEGDRWAAVAGARLEEVREGYARTTMRLEERHLNGVEVGQGGAVFTLADYAFAACSNSHGTVAVALDTSITFCRAALPGPLTAEAREESVTRRTSVCAVRVTDGEGRLVALFRGTAFRREETAADLLALRDARAGGGPGRSPARAKAPAGEAGRPRPAGGAAQRRRQAGRSR